MSKPILISIKPKWVAKILNGEKTIEIRKSYPKCELPIQVYIYCTKDKDNLYRHFKGDFHILKEYRKECLWNGYVVAKFTLNKVEELPNELSIRLAGKILWKHMNEIYEKSCLTDLELLDYLKGKVGYAWHISNLEIFDRPKELNEFIQTKRKNWEEPNVKIPPQSWCYVESEK